MAPLSTKFSNLLVVVLAVPAILLALDADINVAAAPFNRMQRRSAFLAEDSVLQARADGPEGGREHHPHNHHDGQGHREGHPHNHDGHGTHSSMEQGQEPAKREFLEHEMNLVQRDPNFLAEGIKDVAHIAASHHHHVHYQGGSNQGSSNQNRRRDEHNGRVGEGGRGRGGEGDRVRPGEGGRSRGGEGGRVRLGEGGRGVRIGESNRGEGGRRQGEGRGEQPYRRAVAQPPANVNGGTKGHANPSADPVGVHALTNEVPGQANHRTHSQLGDLDQETPGNHRTLHSQPDRDALDQQTSHHQLGYEEGSANHRTPHNQLGQEALDQDTPNSHRNKLGHKKPSHKKPVDHRVHLSQHRHHQQNELHPQEKGSKSGDLNDGKSFIQDQPKQGIQDAHKQGASDLRGGTFPSTSQHDTVTGPEQANPNAATRPHRRSLYSYFDLEDLD